MSQCCQHVGPHEWQLVGLPYNPVWQTPDVVASEGPTKVMAHGGICSFFTLERYVSEGHKKGNKGQETQINLIPNLLQPQLQWSLHSNVNWFPYACRLVTSPIYSLRMRIWVDFAERWTPSSRKESWCSPSPKVKALIHPLELKQDNDKTFPLLREYNCCQNILKWTKVTVKSFHSHVFPIGLVAAIVLILRVQRFCKNIFFSVFRH